MISIRPEFDSSLVQALQHSGWKGVVDLWQEVCARHSLDGLDASAVFSMDELVSNQQFECMKETLQYLAEHRDQSIAHIVQVLPSTDEKLACDVRFLFLPCGTVSYGPKDGLQLFSLYPDADPVEVYLFVVHVYYHEISSLNYTPRCRRCSTRRESAEDFKYWIKLLIRNEGIANYAILDDLLTFATDNSDYRFRYFTYANQLTDVRSLDASFRLLGDIYHGVDDGNLASFQPSLNRLLKNKNLSIINIVGTHMAQAIVSRYGLDALRNVHRKPADDFFNTFRQTDDGHAPIIESLLAKS